jgi:hypothetical protein
LTGWGARSTGRCSDGIRSSLLPEPVKTTVQGYWYETAPSLADAALE